MSEADLAPIVADWLRQSGYAVHSEVMVPTGEEGRRRKVDMIGFAARELCAVELKQHLTTDLLEQAHSCMGYADRIWVAVASHPWTQGDPYSMARLNGFGILRVTDRVQIIEPAATKLPVNQERRNLWLDALAHSEASDDAGRPNLAGEGWRQKCLPEVLSWWKANPRGDWRRCWDTIPNGFRSAAEMKKSFRKAVRDQ